MLNIGQCGLERRGIASGFVGRIPVWPIVRLPMVSAAVAFRRSLKYTSTTCPSWSIARYRYAQRPLSLQHASSTRRFPPTDRASVGAGCLAKQRQEAPERAVNYAAVYYYPTLGEPFDDVCIAQAISDVPLHRERYQVIGEVVPAEGALRAGGETTTSSVAGPALAAQLFVPVSSRRLAPAPHATHRQPLHSVLD